MYEGMKVEVGLHLWKLVLTERCKMKMVDT